MASLLSVGFETLAISSMMPVVCSSKVRNKHKTETNRNKNAPVAPCTTIMKNGRSRMKLGSLSPAGAGAPNESCETCLLSVGCTTHNTTNTGQSVSSMHTNSERTGDGETGVVPSSLTSTIVCEHMSNVMKTTHELNER